MALRMLSRCQQSALRVGQPPTAPQAALLQRSAQFQGRHVSAAGSSDSSAVLNTPSTSIPGDESDSKGVTKSSELPIQQFIWPKLQSKFCRMCGGEMDIIQPDGEREWRHVCRSCSYIGKQQHNTPTCLLGFAPAIFSHAYTYLHGDGFAWLYACSTWALQDSHHQFRGVALSGAGHSVHSALTYRGQTRANDGCSSQRAKLSVLMLCCRLLQPQDGCWLCGST